MIVIILGLIVRSSTQLEMEPQSQTFLHQTFYIKKYFDATTSRDVSNQLLFFF